MEACDVAFDFGVQLRSWFTHQPPSVQVLVRVLESVRRGWCGLARMNAYWKPGRGAQILAEQGLAAVDDVAAGKGLEVV